MDKIELLYDHYKETFSIIQNSIKERNRFFVMMFLMMTLHLLFAISPNSVFLLINSFIVNEFGIDISNYMLIIQSLLWLLLLYLTMRYYQVNVYIEREYNYIHLLEHDIEKIAEIKFDREGGDYLANYPKMNDVIDILYKWVFPIIYCLIILSKIVSEFIFIQCKSTSIVSVILDSLFFFSCFLLTILYLVFLHTNRDS